MAATPVARTDKSGAPAFTIADAADGPTGLPRSVRACARVPRRGSVRCSPPVVCGRHRPPVRAVSTTRFRRACCTAKTAVALLEVDGLPVAQCAVVEENASPHRHPQDWVIPRRHACTPSPGADRGLGLDRVSARHRRPNRRSTVEHCHCKPSFHVAVYRKYGLLRRSAVPADIADLAGAPRGAIQAVRRPFDATASNMVECDWSRSCRGRRPSGRDWPCRAPTSIKLIGSSPETSRATSRFTVRDDTERHAALRRAEPRSPTWQAYRTLTAATASMAGTPRRRKLDYESRSRIVSFDRPYGHTSTALDAHGSGDFLGNEFPFVYLAERHGLDVTYCDRP